MPAVIVEQLNHAQWHASLPNGRGTGVGSWVQAVSDALLCASLHGWSVESLDLEHSRLLLAHAEPVMGRR